MADVKTQIQHLIGPLVTTNPQLHSALSLFVTKFQELEDKINPLVAEVRTLQAGDTTPPATPINLIGSIEDEFIRLDWDEGDNIPRIYEVRWSFLGNDWNNASFIARTPSTQIEINPVAPIGGVRRYYVKARNSNGVYSPGYAYVDITFPEITAPVVSANVIDNNVLLTWSNSVGPFRIRHYLVYKGADFYGFVTGNFAALFETTSGVFTYRVQAQDIAGNFSPFGEITVTVSQPPDFELFHTWESVFKVIDPDPAGDFQVYQVDYDNVARIEI